MKSILLIEDDVFIRDLYIRVLKKEAGFDIRVAEDGESGLKEVEDRHPDLILLDVMLPKINGIDVLKELKQNTDTKDIPVFLLTNLGQRSIIDQAFSIGADGYMLKARLLPNEIVEKVTNFFANGKPDDDMLQSGI